MQFTAAEISELVNGTIEGDPKIRITGPAKIEEAGYGTISFLANPKYEKFIYDSKVSALLVPINFKPKKPVSATLIKVKDVYAAVSTLLAEFDTEELENGISSQSFISQGAIVEPTAFVDAYSYIGRNSRVGANTVIMPQTYIGKNVQIGENCKIYPGARILDDTIIGNNCIIQANAVIGSEGFGYSRNSDGSYKRIHHMGNVILEDHVEVGANTTIDRAVLGSTIIREGVKLDNLIQIAHNVEIGEHSAMAAQSGIAGSGKIGAYCQIGGQAGIIGHIELPDGTMVQAQSGVIRGGLKPKSKLFGSPAIEYSNYLKSYAIFKNLPSLLNEIRELKRHIKENEKD